MRETARAVFDRYPPACAGEWQRGERNARKQRPQPAEVGVFRPEGRAPLRVDRRGILTPLVG